MSTITEAQNPVAVLGGGAPDGGMGDYIEGLKKDCGFIISRIDSIVSTLTGFSLLEALFKPIAGDFNTVSSMQKGWGNVGVSLGAVGDNYRSRRCRGSTATPTPRLSAPASRTSSSACPRPGAAGPARSCGCCRSASSWARVRQQVEETGTLDARLFLAIDERDLAPVGLDVDREPHLLAFGDSRSGKSALLRTYAQEIMRTRTAKDAQLVVVDYRRSLLGEVSDDYQLHYLTSTTQAAPAVAELAAYLQQRLPGPDVTPDQLRNRSWWTGAEVFVVVDDYDLVATQSGSPLTPLVPLLAQARDVGLHLALARRSGGAARALYEPVIQSLRDLAMPGVLLSGSPDEGPLIGTAKPRKSVPGRAQLVTRDRGVEVVQTAWTEPSL